MVALIDNDDLTISQDINAVEDTLNFFDMAGGLESHYLAPSLHNILPPFITLSWFTLSATIHLAQVVLLPREIIP